MREGFVVRSMNVVIGQHPGKVVTKTTRAMQDEVT
jgi:hypothetical protein